MQRSLRASWPSTSLAVRLASCFAACLTIVTVSGCSQVVDFDRSKIADDKDGASPRDSGMGGMDSGSKDAGSKDSGIKVDAGDDAGEDACDPATHEGCEDSQLCCADADGVLGCVPTSVAQCEGCGMACDANVANDCTERTCGCGGISKVECSGATPKCDAAQDKCVECVSSEDCSANATNKFCFARGATADAKDNTCVACDPATNAGCAGTTPICNASATCEACTASPNNCDGTLVCLSAGPSAGACQCSASSDCTTPTTPICDGMSKLCVGCTTNAQCNAKKAGDVCETATGDCVDCLQNTDCAATEYCSSKVCTVKKTPGVSCGAAAECASGFCVDGVCCNNACAGTCNACTTAKKGSGANGACGAIAATADPDNECAGALSCNGSGACEKVAGAGCSGAAECASGFCADGVCCDSACGGVCNACTAAKKGSGANGACGAITASTDPDNECTAGICNGAGACAQCVANPDCAAVPGKALCDTTTNSCVACRNSEDCTTTPGTPICNASKVCAACASNAECLALSVADDFCVTGGAGSTVGSCAACNPANDNGCTVVPNTQCRAGATPTCVECDATGGCSAGSTKPSCEIASHTCVCTGQADCSGNLACVAKECKACTIDADCTGHPTGAECANTGAAFECQQCDPKDPLNLTDDEGCPMDKPCVVASFTCTP